MAKSLIAADTGVQNTQLFYNELDRLMGASIGVIAVRTREMHRGKLLMHQWASMRGMDFHVWDCVKGFQSYRPLPTLEGEGGAEIVVEAEAMNSYLTPTGPIAGTESIMSAMEHYATRAGNKDTDRNMFCGVFMGVVDEWVKEPFIQQSVRDQVQRGYQCNDRMILMLTPGSVIPDAILGDVEVIDLSPPSFSELLETFTDMETSIPEDFGYTPDDDDRATIVQNGLGMTGQEFENAISLAIVDISASVEAAGDNGFDVDVHSFVRVVRGRKLEILKQTKIMELMREASIESVGGLDLLKADLELRKTSFTPEARAYGIKPPKGFLVVGPPGTGKSLLCEASSAALGIPAIRFDMGSVYGSLVGQSEQRMRGSLKMAEDMAPCILFIDEIDKAIGSGESSGDSGVAKRVFGTLLTWMQEKQTKNIPILVIASANNVENMPPELLRKGRFDEIWAVSFPSPKERAQILRIHVEKRGHKLTDAEYVEFAKQSNNFVGAEIEAIVETALLADFNAGHKGIMLKTLLDKLDKTIPQAKVFPEKIERMRKWCEQNARPASSNASFDVDPIGPSGKAMLKPTPRRGPLKLASKSNRN